MRKTIAIVLCISIFWSSLFILDTFAISNEIELFSQNMSNNFNQDYSLSGNQADDMLNVAKKQLGKTSSDLGYTEAWCANFVCDVARLVGVDKNIIPYNKYDVFGSCTLLYNYMVDTCNVPKVTNRQKGDLVFYYCSSCSAYVHIGIVEDETYSIEGNLSNSVKRVTNTYYSHTPNSTKHSISNGIITPKYLRPQYEKNNIITPTAPTISYPSNVHDYISGYECTYFDLDMDGSLSVWYDSENAEKYKYSIKKLTADPDPTSDNEGVLLDSGVTSESSINIPSPNYGTWYKVGIQAVSSTGHTSSWKVRYIRTKCAKPYLTQPSSDAEMNSDEYIALRWNNGTNNSKSYLKLIELQGKPNPSSESEPYSRIIVNEEVCSGNTYYASNLTAGKYYKAMVKARNTTYSEEYMPFSWSSSPVYIYVRESTPSTIPVTSVSLKSSTTLEVGEVETLFATVKPTNATNQNVTWKSSNTSVASVSSGQVTAKSAGTATITVTTADGGYKATCVVTVKEETNTLCWYDYKDGDTFEYTIDSSSTKPPRPMSISYTTTSTETPLMTVSKPGVIEATLDAENQCIDFTCAGAGTTTLSLTVGIKTISLVFNITDAAESGSEDTIAWSNYENGDTFEYTIDSSSTTPPRPMSISYTTTSTETPSMTLSEPGVIEAELDEENQRIDFTCVGAGTTTLTLSLGGKAISLIFNVTDTAQNDSDDILAWSDYKNGEVIEVTTNTNWTISDRTVLISYATTSVKEPLLAISHGGVVDATLYKSSKAVSVTYKKAGTATISISVEGITISLVFKIIDIDPPTEFDLSWRDCENGAIYEYTIDSSDARPKRPYTFWVTLTPENYSYSAIDLKISDENVLKATADGSSVTVTPKSGGQSTVTLTIDEKSISLNFVITDIAQPSTIAVESVTLDKTTATLNENETLILIATVLPSDATNKNVRWTSSNENVAIVSQSGVVTAISTGTTTITATTEDGNITVSCAITVIEPVEEDGLVDSGTDSNGINWYFYETGLLKISGTGAMQNHSSTATIPWYSEKANITEIEISGGITHIGNRSFYNCISAEKISIPNSVISIGTYAFRNCDMLTIYAESGTYAETYALENNISFNNTKIEDMQTITIEAYENNSKWCFDISIGEYEEAVAYVAIYDSNGKMLSVSFDKLMENDVTTLNISKLGNESASYAKIFVWKNSQKPLAYSSKMDI